MSSLISALIRSATGSTRNALPFNALQRGILKGRSVSTHTTAASEAVGSSQPAAAAHSLAAAQTLAIIGTGITAYLSITKQISEVEHRLDKKIHRLDTRIGHLEVKIARDNADLREKMAQDNADLREKIARLGGDMKVLLVLAQQGKFPTNSSF